MKTVTFVADSSDLHIEKVDTHELDKIIRQSLDVTCDYVLQRATTALLPLLNKDSIIEKEFESGCFEYEYRGVKFLIRVNICKWDAKFTAYVTLEIPKRVQDFDDREIW